MIIKKFQGKTEEEAIEAAKKELGVNVVVMNVKNVKKKGLFAFLKPSMVEVTVALEEESERAAAAPPKKVEKPEFSADIIREEPNHPERRASDSGHSEKVIEEKLESLHTLIEQQLSKEAEADEDIHTETDDSRVTFVKLIYNTLIDNEVDEKYANQLLDEIEKINKPNATIDFILANIYQKLILKFGQPHVIMPTEHNSKVVFFVGPTGVGKTTTIAKIASKFCVNDKKKVALLTTDTYRIAAAEQLRTYANILDAPFRVIYSTEEITTAIEDFKSYDYILIDTAGHSHHNETQKLNMSQFIHCVDEDIEKEVYLVVSATTKYRDLISIADTYSQMTDYRLIFTKLDETTTLGNLLNLKLHTGADLSYVTCGQNVPDDMEQFNPQTTVKQLLGGK
ncbi:MAG TPA: flagellar biosynthesis protein FlhF [Lachnospiraceae bacterium]|nr:flagellar biosynthesis protein FlhF [Lachnospiraceae bacterium]